MSNQTYWTGEFWDNEYWEGQYWFNSEIHAAEYNIGSFKIRRPAGAPSKRRKKKYVEEPNTSRFIEKPKVVEEEDDSHIYLFLIEYL